MMSLEGKTERMRYRGSNLQHKKKLSVANTKSSKKKTGKGQGYRIRRLVLMYTKKSVSVVDNPQDYFLLLSFHPSFLSHRH